MEEDKDLNC